MLQLLRSYGIRIFARLSLPVVQAVADTGRIGGSLSHEFHLLSATGEDTILTCAACGYAANDEKAECLRAHCVSVLMHCSRAVAHHDGGEAGAGQLCGARGAGGVGCGGNGAPRAQHCLFCACSRATVRACRSLARETALLRLSAVVLHVHDELNDAKVASVVR